MQDPTPPAGRGGKSLSLIYGSMGIYVWVGVVPGKHGQYLSAASLNDGLDSRQGRDCNGLVLDSVPRQPLSLEKEVNGLASWIGSIKEKDGSMESKEAAVEAHKWAPGNGAQI